MISFGYMKILISMPDNLVSRIDEYCGKHDFERSEFIRAVLRERIEGIEPAQIVSKVVEEVKDKMVPDEAKGYGTGQSDVTWGNTTWEWCTANKAHEFVAGRLLPCVRVSSTQDGYPAAIEKKIYKGDWICVDCANKIVESIPPDVFISLEVV